MTDMPESPMSPMEAQAITLQEFYRALRVRGFSRWQAFALLKIQWKAVCNATVLLEQDGN